MELCVSYIGFQCIPLSCQAHEKAPKLQVADPDTADAEEDDDADDDHDNTDKPELLELVDAIGGQGAKQLTSTQSWLDKKPPRR